MYVYIYIYVPWGAGSPENHFWIMSKYVGQFQILRTPEALDWKDSRTDLKLAWKINKSFWLRGEKEFQKFLLFKKNRAGRSKYRLDVQNIGWRFERLAGHSEK